MNVKELIAELRKYPEHMTVVVDRHSEYAEVGGVAQLVGYDNGGYVSTPYSEHDKAKSRPMVYLS